MLPGVASHVEHDRHQRVAQFKESRLVPRSDPTRPTPHPLTPNGPITEDYALFIVVAVIAHRAESACAGTSSAARTVN